METLHIDCAGDGLAKRPPKKIFSSKKITLQSVRTCQQVFSAALLGFVEATFDEDEKKNELCKPVPHPNSDIDFLRNTIADATNQERWINEPVLNRWLEESRLNPQSHILKGSFAFKALSIINKIPFIKLSNRALEAQASAQKTIKQLLETEEVDI